MLLSLSLIILIGFSFSEIALRIKLPRIVGMLLAGVVLGPFVLNLLAPEVLAISLDLRQIALVIILLRADLSLNLKDLKKVGRHAIFMAFVPATFEIIGALVLGPLLLGMTLLESAIMGTILAAVSPAVVVPKMLKLMNEGVGTKKSIPQMIIAGASADDIFVIVLFTSLVSMAKEGNFSLLTFVKLPISIILGIGVGILLGLAMVWFFRKFHLRDTSKVLIIISFVLFLVTVERLDYFPFSGLLATVALGITILAKYPVLANRLVVKYEKIWVFAEMLLFVLVGTAVDITTIPSIGVYLATLGKTLTFKEQLFSVFAYLPKATVQASISSIPLALGISNGGTMLTVVVLAILITAPIGALLIDLTAKPLLGNSSLEIESDNG